MFFAAAAPRALLILAVVWLVFVSGCARLPNTGVTSIKSSKLSELENHLLTHAPDVDVFRERGPFDTSTRTNVELRLSASESVAADLYLSSHRDKAPLVVLLHGHDNSKNDHAYQAMHLATWGMHALVVQLPNRGPWIIHGRTLTRIVEFIQARSEVLSGRIDTNKIILAGHSFGASSAVVALAAGAPVTGGVLLDPAGVGRDLQTYLNRIDKPLMVLGADEAVFAALDRDAFYRYVRRRVAEVSIRDAAHEDAQFPLEPEPDSVATEEHRITFVSALTAAAFSLAATGNYDYAWMSFSDAVKNGKFINPRKK